MLFSRLKSKDEEAFIEAYDLYTDKIFRFVYFKIGNIEEAQDLTSLIFLKAWNYIRSNAISDYKTLKSLIYKIARNSIVDYYREKSARAVTTMSGEGEELENKIDEDQDLLKRAELTFDLAVVEKKLMELKDEYREIIVLRFIEEFSIKEIAKILDKSNVNTRVLIYRALKALKKIMEE